MSYVKNTVLTALSIIVFMAALSLILYITDAISREDLMEVITKGGLVLLVIVVAMLIMGAIKKASQ